MLVQRATDVCWHFPHAPKGLDTTDAVHSSMAFCNGATLAQSGTGNLTAARTAVTAEAGSNSGPGWNANCRPDPNVIGTTASVMLLAC